MDIWDRYYKDSELIDNFHDRIDSKNYTSVLNKLYSFLKKICYNYYENGEILKQYYFLKTEMLLVEKKIKDIKEFDIKAKYNELDKSNFIENIVFKVREFILQNKNLYSSNDIENEELFNSLNLANDCYMSSLYVKKICDENNICSNILSIYPGYNEKANLFDGNGFHFSNVVEYNNKWFLIDTTFSQFFYSNRNNLNRLGIMGCAGCDPGVFILMSDKGKEMAYNLIENGYVELDEDLFKIYFDAFTVSFRNGLYYEDTNDFSFSTNYSFDDYINFLSGVDNQLNYENKDYLGFQKSPLKNRKLSFKKR